MSKNHGKFASNVQKDGVEGMEREGASSPVIGLRSYGEESCPARTCCRLVRLGTMPRLFHCTVLQHIGEGSIA